MVTFQPSVMDSTHSPFSFDDVHANLFDDFDDNINLTNSPSGSEISDNSLMLGIALSKQDVRLPEKEPK